MGLRLLLTSFATGVSAVLLGVVLVSTLLTSDPTPRPTGSPAVAATQLPGGDPTQQPPAEEPTSSPSPQAAPTEEVLSIAAATEIPATTTATPPPVPPGEVASPSGLTAVYAEGGVSLTWNVVAGAGYFNIYRSQVPGGGPGATYTAIGSSGSPSARDHNVASGQTYYYVVTASSDATESASSNEATIRVP